LELNLTKGQLKIAFSTLFLENYFSYTKLNKLLELLVYALEKLKSKIKQRNTLTLDKFGKEAAELI